MMLNALYRVFYSVEIEACKMCSKSIPSNCVQIVIDGQSQPQQSVKCTAECYHVECFFKLHQPQTDADFDGMANLRCDDQALIREHLGELMFQLTNFRPICGSKKKKRKRTNNRHASI